MRDLAALLTFEPLKLSAARVRVQEDHPTVGQLFDFVPAGADFLRERVALASQSKDGLEALAFELTAVELRHVVRSIAIWSDLREEIAVMAQARPKAEFVRLLWHAWEGSPRAAEVWGLFSDMVRRFGLGTLPGVSVHPNIEAWTAKQDPLPSMVLWLGDRRTIPSQLLPPPDSPFRPDTPLIRRMEQGILLYGDRGQLVDRPVWWIRDGWNTLGPEELMVACANYLERLPAGEWDASLLVLIRNGYGMPGTSGSESIARFWDSVSEETRRAFRRHFISADLARAFRGDTDRHAYWKRWGDQDQILEVVIGSAGDTDWARMDFRGFAVLEFFEVGNAAFFLPQTVLHEIPWGRSPSKDRLKKKIRNPVSGYSDNRLIHNGRWQGRANEMMAVWMRRFG